MDAETIEHLKRALAGSVSPDATIRAAADDFLRSAASHSGAALGLLALASDAATEIGTRQSASIYFKHMCAKSWSASRAEQSASTTTPAAALDEGEKAAVRRVALEAISTTPSKVRSQLLEAVRVMVHHDFPERWPEIATQVLEALTSEANASASGRLVGTVMVLNALCRKYEFKDESDRGDVEEIIRVVFPRLLEILKALLAYNGPPNAELEELKKAICKTYWSATYMNVGPSLAAEGTFREWMSAFHAIITAEVPTEGMPTEDKTELKHWPWWKTKKWAMHVVNRMFSRYGNAKQVKAEHKPLSTMYRNNYAAHFLRVYIEFLSKLSAGAIMPDRVVNLAVQHLSTAVSLPLTYKVMEPHLDEIFQRVIFPILCFNAEDDELFADDPHEYVRKSQDFIEDMYSPRMAAIGYLNELCSKSSKRMENNLPRVLAVTVQIFQAHAQAVASRAQMETQARYALDGALLIVTHLASTLERHDTYKQQLEAMIMTHVHPAFTCAHAHIRAKAVACASKYSGIEFTSEQNFLTLFSSVVQSMKDQQLPVQVEAVVALGSFIQETDDVSNLKPLIPQLLDDFFKLMNEVESEDIVYTLETITEKFGEDIAPYALHMTQNLAAAFWKVVESESKDDDDDMGMLGAIGVLRAMSTILESISGLPHMYPELEAAVFPILHKMLSDQGYDVFEEVLEILAYLTYFTPEVTPRMWELWPLMMTTMDDWALQYFENMLIPLDNYISRGTQHFLTPGTSYVEDTYDICKKVLEGEYPEPDCLSAPKLMECVMTNCRGRVDVVIEPYINIALARLERAEMKYFKDLLMMTFAHALHYNPVLALQATNRTGATNEVFARWSAMLSVRTKSGDRHCFTSEHSKKVCALGLMSLMTAPDDVLTPEIRGALGGILDTLVSLVQDLKTQIDDRTQDEQSGKRRYPWEESDEEYEDPNGLVDDDEDDENADLQFDEATLRALAKKAQDADPYSRAGDIDDSDDEFWFDDDDDSCTSPLDDIDTFIALSDCMNALQASGRPINASASSMETLQALMRHAVHRRSVFPEERAKAKSKSGN